MMRLAFRMGVGRPAFIRPRRWRGRPAGWSGTGRRLSRLVLYWRRRPGRRPANVAPRPGSWIVTTVQRLQRISTVVMRSEVGWRTSVRLYAGATAGPVRRNRGAVRIDRLAPFTRRLGATPLRARTPRVESAPPRAVRSATTARRPTAARGGGVPRSQGALVARATARALGAEAPVASPRVRHDHRHVRLFAHVGSAVVPSGPLAARLGAAGPRALVVTTVAAEGAPAGAVAVSGSSARPPLHGMRMTAMRRWRTRRASRLERVARKAASARTGASGAVLSPRASRDGFPVPASSPSHHLLVPPERPDRRARPLVPVVAAGTGRTAASRDGVALVWRTVVTAGPTVPARAHGARSDQAAGDGSTVAARTSATTPSRPSLPPRLDGAAIDRLAEDVMQRIDRRMRIERERRGL